MTMADYPDDLRYTDSHEYVRLEGEIATIGITSFAVRQLGDIVFVELPDTGTKIEQEEIFGTVESVKAVETLIAPLSGTVIEYNTAVVDDPEIVSDDPYGEGWFIKVQVDNLTDLDDTLSRNQYLSLIEGV
ncbi:glycine cleavage system protein GcvH [Planktothrix sp. FACHB-1365]|uniref:glycine cleavage system protein GcvH n=1 Tax=Planktothrix sp. FACHB-1365 TaxID=2692855 RepID=UPI00168254A1|nr:glycine cleavage system protein GcvH [Planktothrix sp. FACHB-1365]MBD2484338.1 glycine cleavage system protein GcvH [Planktothrix sp. FACHB-1365]